MQDVDIDEISDGLNESDGFDHAAEDAEELNDSIMMIEKLNAISANSDFMRALENDMTFKIDKGLE